MYIMQDQGTVGFETMQALRVRVCLVLKVEFGTSADIFDSGDKKTKGAALVF
jgi:hypothetical protein